MTDAGADVSLERARDLPLLWLDALRDVASRSAHDLKNVLNGVAVNLEVARSRSARGGDVATVAPFAATAAAEFERATTMVEAMLALCRPTQQPVDVAELLFRLGGLLGGPEGERVTLPPRLSGGRGVFTSAPSDGVAAVLARALLAATADDGTAMCEMRCERGILVHVRRTTGDVPPLDAELTAAVFPHGIRAVRTGPEMQIFFPSLAP